MQEKQSTQLSARASLRGGLAYQKAWAFMAAEMLLGKLCDFRVKLDNPGGELQVALQKDRQATATKADHQTGGPSQVSPAPATLTCNAGKISDFIFWQWKTSPSCTAPSLAIRTLQHCNKLWLTACPFL